MAECPKNPNERQNIRSPGRNWSQSPDRVVIGAPNSSAAIVIDKNDQKNAKGKYMYAGKNARINLLVGVQGPDWNESREIKEIDYSKTPAGLVIAERSTPLTIFNQDAEGEPTKKILAIPRPGMGPSRQATAEAINSGEPSATLWGGTVNVIASSGGFTVYTKPFVDYVKATEMVKAKSKGNIGVALVHANAADKLEPMVKGNKLDAALGSLTNDIINIQDTIKSIVVQQEAHMELLAFHTHIAAPLVGGPVSPSPSANIVNAVTAVSRFKTASNNIINAINVIVGEINKTDAFQSSYKSDFHYLN